MATAARPFQVTVWGATGFVGRLVCERLATEYPNRLRVAVAGRDDNKLRNLKTDLLAASFQDVGIFVAAADDRDAIDAFTSSTDVVISCAGPYRKYSSQVVASSVANGAHYLDLTAELPWVRENIRKHHEKAKEKNVKVVHFCGYDSVPMDLGTLLTVQTVKQRYESGCRLVEMYMGNAFGGISGGTAASGIDIYASASPAERTALDDPLCLHPDYINKRSGRSFEGTMYNASIDKYNVPFLFAKFNIPVIQRSAALAKDPYGKDFVYRDGVQAPNLPAALTIGFVGTLMSLSFEYSLFQSFVKMISPNPGSGPNKDVQRRQGFWRLFLIGYPESPPDDNPDAFVRVKIENNHGDPGYWSTSKMLVECALSLVFDADAVAQAASQAGGVLTPASALGLIPLNRLKSNGFVVDVC